MTAGEAIWVKVTLTNTSDHSVNGSSVRSGGVDVSYSYDVREISGQPVAKTKRNVGKHVQSVLTRSLKPGESAEQESLVSRLYDMSLPGEYQIQLARSVSDDPKDGLVKSNKITVVVNR